MKSLEPKILEVIKSAASDQSKAHQIALLCAEELRDFMLALYNLPGEKGVKWTEKRKV